MIAWMENERAGLRGQLLIPDRNAPGGAVQVPRPQPFPKPRHSHFADQVELAFKVAARIRREMSKIV
jgi:hypothetical protein